MIATYIWNLFSNKHYWLHSLVKFWASIVNIKRTRILQILDTLEIKANLNNILTWISQLEVWIVCQYICDAQKYAHVHSKWNPERYPWPFMVQMCQMTKMGTLGVGVTLNQPCCYGYQSSDGNTFLNLFSIKHYLKQS